MMKHQTLIHECHDIIYVDMKKYLDETIAKQHLPNIRNTILFYKGYEYDFNVCLTFIDQFQMSL